MGVGREGREKRAVWVGVGRGRGVGVGRGSEVGRRGEQGRWVVEGATPQKKSEGPGNSVVQTPDICTPMEV